MPSYKTDWPWKSWNPVIRNHAFGNSSIYYIHTLSEIIFLVTYLFPCAREFHGISGETIHGIQRYTFENSLFIFNIHCMRPYFSQLTHYDIFVNFKHVFISLLYSPLLHCTWSFWESMFWEMQMAVYGESSIRRLFYSEYPQNWLYWFFNSFSYQLPSFLNNIRRNQFRINYPVFLWFQVMRIV